MARGRALKKDIRTLVPRWNVEIFIRSMTVHQYNELIKKENIREKFDCDKLTFLKLRYFPFDVPAGETDWWPNSRLLFKVAAYFGCTVDALYNRTKQPLFTSLQLELLKQKKIA